MSNINPQNIDGTFPIAGQDNNSQGFRDNFTNTINNFTFAAAELTDLQTYAVLTAPLSSVGQTGTPTNNMNYAYLTKPQLKAAVETITDLGVISSGGSFSVDWSVAHFQTVNLTTSATMSFASTWPTTNLWTRLRLQITATNTVALTLPTSVSVNISNIQGWTSGTTVSLPAGTYVFEFSTSNNGSAVTIQDVLRNYNVETSGTTGTFTSVIAGSLSSGFVGNVGTVITGASVSANTLNITGNIVGGLTQLAAINNTPIGNASASTGAFTTLSASGDITLSGNVTRAGGQIDSGYQYYAPSGNAAITANVNVSRVILDPAGDGYGIVFTLPGGNVDAKVITLSSTANIAAVQLVGSTGTTVAPSVNVAMTKGTSIQFFYHAVETKWYKIG